LPNFLCFSVFIFMYAVLIHLHRIASFYIIFHFIMVIRVYIYMISNPSHTILKQALVIVCPIIIVYFYFLLPQIWLSLWLISHLFILFSIWFSMALVLLILLYTIGFFLISCIWFSFTFVKFSFISIIEYVCLPVSTISSGENCLTHFMPLVHIYQCFDSKQ
jgi:hypothetical protein